MFYRAGEPHGLRHNPFNAIVIPRPIGWISSIDARGVVNLAPYSFFNAVAYTPPQVVFSATSVHGQDGGLKDTVANVLETKEFVVNLATWDLRAAMNLSSAPAPRDVDEFTIAGNLKSMYRDIEAVGADVDPRSHIRTGSILIGRMTVAGGGESSS